MTIAALYHYKLLSPLQLKYFELCRPYCQGGKWAQADAPTLEDAARECRRMNAAELRQAIAALAE